MQHPKIEYDLSKLGHPLDISHHDSQIEPSIMVNNDPDILVDERTQFEKDLDDENYQEFDFDDALRELDISTISGDIPPLSQLKATFQTKSAIIRHLFTEYKLTVKEISKHTGIRYQQVRNVLTNELKRGPNEPFTLTDGKSSAALKPLLLPQSKKES